MGIFATLGTAIVSGISGYFKDKNEIKKVEVEAEKMLVLAKAEAEANKMKRESEQDYDLDKIALKYTISYRSSYRILNLE